jgi:hypothetical protein
MLTVFIPINHLSVLPQQEQEDDQKKGQRQQQEAQQRHAADYKLLLGQAKQQRKHGFGFKSKKICH